MGHHIYFCSSKILIKKRNIPKIIKAIQGLDKPEKHFAWVEPGFKKYKRLNTILKKWRWEAIYSQKRVICSACNGNGSWVGVKKCPTCDGCGTTVDHNDIIGLEFLGEKTGDDDILLTTIAKYVENESYIHLHDYHTHILYTFHNGECFCDTTPYCTR